MTLRSLGYFDPILFLFHKMGGTSHPWIGNSIFDERTQYFDGPLNALPLKKVNKSSRINQLKQRNLNKQTPV